MSERRALHDFWTAQTSPVTRRDSAGPGRQPAESSIVNDETIVEPLSG